MGENKERSRLASSTYPLYEYQSLTAGNKIVGVHLKLSPCNK